MVTVAEMQSQNEHAALVRKVLHWVGLVAPMDVDLPDELTDGSGELIAVPTGWTSIGLVTPDGLTFGRDTEKDDIPALGHASPVRSDITGVERSVSFTSLEYGRKELLEIWFGQSLDGIEPDEGGEVVIDEVDLPIGLERRLLFIGGDGSGDDAWVLGRAFPRVKLADAGEQQWQQEGAIEQEFTFDVFTDDELGFPVRHYIGGPGAVKHADALGFDA